MAYDGRRYTAADVFTPEILTMAAEEQRKAAAAFLAALGREVAIYEPDVSRGRETIPYPALLNVIEGNIQRLCDGGYWCEAAGRLATWRGELDDRPRFSYEDVNRWFDASAALAGVAQGTAAAAAVAGRGPAGAVRQFQQIRIK